MVIKDCITLPNEYDTIASPKHSNIKYKRWACFDFTLIAMKRRLNIVVDKTHIIVITAVILPVAVLQLKATSQSSSAYVLNGLSALYIERTSTPMLLVTTVTYLPHHNI